MTTLLVPEMSLKSSIAQQFKLNYNQTQIIKFMLYVHAAR